MRELMISLGMIKPANPKILKDMEGPTPQRWFEEGERVTTCKRNFKGEIEEVTWIVQPTLRMHWRDRKQFVPSRLIVPTFGENHGI
jgi:hypothetical protein